MEPAIEDLLAQVREQQQRIEEIQRSVATMELTAYAGNGDVTVKLKGDGRFTEVTIDPQVLRRYDAQTLGQLVLEAVNDGLAKLAAANEARYAPLLGEAQQ
ncbi:YbaB/EbfC family nucleoid-associated protein [Micromonospora sp. NPDC047620]|uniref:YbaB/EbfC family nucleoid-associated protein n=1 Tax=Micromonospora sp. NPDC047620 TaxID=3364251 RepID=UPI00371F90EA